MRRIGYAVGCLLFPVVAWGLYFGAAFGLDYLRGIGGRGLSLAAVAVGLLVLWFATAGKDGRR